MERRVVITGAGVLSTLGDAPGALHTALCEGRTGLRPIGLFPTKGLASQQAHELADFAPKDYLGKKKICGLWIVPRGSSSPLPPWRSTTVGGHRSCAVSMKSAWCSVRCFVASGPFPNLIGAG